MGGTVEINVDGVGFGNDGEIGLTTHIFLESQSITKAVWLGGT